MSQNKQIFEKRGPSSFLYDVNVYIYKYMRQFVLYICYIYIYIDKLSIVRFSNIKRKSNNKTQKAIPLVVTYHSLLKSLSSIVNNNIYLLHMAQEVKRTFTPQPAVSYQSERKLNSYLVRAKLYPIKRKVGLCKCKGKRCEICKNVLETDTFTCNNDPTTCKINHQFDCNEKCLVYLITCNKYLKQYVGQTVDMFRSR